MNKEEKAALVKAYCNENTKPKQDLCPEVNQYIRTSKGYEIWNSKDLSREPINFDPTRWREVRACGLNNVVCVRNVYEGLYIEYHEDMDALEFAHIFMDGGRGKDGEAKEWTYGMGWNVSRYFIFRNDPNAYTYFGTIFTGNDHYSKDLLKEMKSWARRSLVGTENYDEFKKFAPDSCELREYNQLYRTPLAQIWQYARWYQMDFIKRDKSKTFTDIENYELNDFTPHRLIDDNMQAYFYILDDKYAVLRIYKFPSSLEIRHGANKDNATEVVRLFISAKGKPTLMVEEYGSWKIKSSTPWNASGNLIFVNESEMSKWTPLKYIIPCLDLHHTGIDELVGVLRHPIVEQLSKAGYPNVANKLQEHRQIALNLKNYFLVEKEKKLPMFKLLGVNKFALNAAERYEGNLRIIREIKFFMGGFDVTEASEEICNYIANYIGCTDSCWWGNSITNIIPGYVRGYGYKNRYATPITDEQKKWILKIFRMESKQAGCIELFDDVVKTYNKLRGDHRPDIDIYNVKGYEDISRLHDALIELKIQQDREDQALRDASERERQAMLQKKFEKLQKDRIEKFEYEDENFCVRVPHELNEITREGIYLHHCVGGYLDRHAQGGTNILFLRRKADENTPFYTIEINNNDTVVQIHGSHNRWLGNDPDAVPFVYKYLNKIGAGFEIKLLLNKGSGYRAGDENLPESYLQAA